MVASFEKDYSKLNYIMPIIYKSTKTPVTLYQWTESHHQPGLICALSQPNNSPVVIFIQSNTFNIYDFKVDSTKSKVQGIVLNVNIKNYTVEGNLFFLLTPIYLYFRISYYTFNTYFLPIGRTSLILLYDDGSLRIHCIKTEKIVFWQTYIYNNSSPLQNFRSKRRVKSIINDPSSLSIPVDIFEACHLCDDIEFGGNDILHVYNQSQIKSRYV